MWDGIKDVPHKMRTEGSKTSLIAGAARRSGSRQDVTGYDPGQTSDGEDYDCAKEL